MFADDNAVEEKTSTTSGQIALPMNIQFSVSCEINPANPAQPSCRIRYLRPQFLGISEEVEDDVAASITTNEKTPKKVKESHPKTHSKASKSNKDEDNNSSDDDDDDDDSDEETPVLRCVAESFDRD